MVFASVTILRLLRRAARWGVDRQVCTRYMLEFRRSCALLN